MASVGSLTSLYKVLDFHIHTNLSSCAFSLMSVPFILERMVELGYERIGIVDHVASERAARDVEIKRRAVAACGGLEVHLGVELCLVRPGCFRLPPASLAGADYVIAAATHFGMPGVDDPPPGTSAEVADYVAAMFESAAAEGRVDIVGHPFCAPALLGPGRPFADMYEMMAQIGLDRLQPAIDRLARAGIAVELSAKMLSPTVFGALFPFFRRCRDAGVRFAFGSDAHRPESLGMTRGFAPIIELLEIGDEHVWQPAS